MNKKNFNPLLDDYYKGETSLEQEAVLRDEIRRDENTLLEEKDLFNYYRSEAKVPENLEEKIFRSIQKDENRSRIIRSAWFRYSAIAAAICLVATIFWFNHNNQTTGKLSDEEQFAILEQALLEISFSVQPAENQDLLVLFQDENLEIVMN